MTPHRGWLRPTLASGAVVVLGAAVVAAVAIRLATGEFWIDLACFRTSAAAAGSGDGEVYKLVFFDAGSEFRFVYTPFAALVLQPLAYVSMVVAIGAWTLASLAALVVAVWVALRAAQVAPGQRIVPALLITVGALPMLAVAGHLQAGQVGVFLMLIVLLDLTSDPRHWWHGIGVGVAAGLKLTPLIFIAYLVIIGRIRAAATATAAFAGTIVIGYLWRPSDSRWYFSGGMFQASRVTEDPRVILNQSLRGAMARLTDSADPGLAWLMAAAIVGAAGLLVARRCFRAGDPFLALIAVAATGLLVSPISWHHHWIWIVPALTLLGVRAWRAGSRAGLAAVGAIWLVFVASMAWALVSVPGHLGGWGLLYENLYVLVGLIGLGYLASPIWSRIQADMNASSFHAS